MRVVATIQARMRSSRLPGKVLKMLSGKPMLLWQVERIRRSRLVDQVFVATTTSTVDDEIAFYCKKNKIDCFRGSEEDVLNRIASLIRKIDVDLHVECYGDSPLTDPQLIDEFIGFYLKHKLNYDYVANSMDTTYPPGMEVAVYPGYIINELEKRLPTDDPLREHVGYNITRFPDQYRLFSLVAPVWYRYPDTYLEVDTIADFEKMRKIIGHFSKLNIGHFTLSQILDLLQSKPEWNKINMHEERRWKKLRDEVARKSSKVSLMS
jgi:spore coat polysaccharide biosynthesis protein SpsF